MCRFLKRVFVSDLAFCVSALSGTAVQAMPFWTPVRKHNQKTSGCTAQGGEVYSVKLNPNFRGRHSLPFRTTRLNRFRPGASVDRRSRRSCRCHSPAPMRACRLNCVQLLYPENEGRCCSGSEGDSPACHLAKHVCLGFRSPRRQKLGAYHRHVDRGLIARCAPHHAF